MISENGLAEKIMAAGFKCISCGTCCRSDASDPGYVLVMPDEVRALMAITQLPWEGVARPYPEVIEDKNGSRYMLGWCLRHKDDACLFLHDGKCTVYASRPWICRTYPFMLDGDELKISDCRGIGNPISLSDARQIARDLILRQKAEEEEAHIIRRHLLTNSCPAGSLVVLDRDGCKVQNG